MSATSVTPRTRPPFRADHVGSLLRPERLKEARHNLLGPQTPDSHLGPHDNAELRAVEDECIREVVAMQERAGLRSVTDGEFRRRSWWLDLPMGWQCFKADRTGTMEFTWRNAKGERMPFSRLWTTGKIEWQESATAKAVKFLCDVTKQTAKVTIPAPFLMHMYGGGDKGVLEAHYTDLEQWWADLTVAYRKEVEALIAAGARYIQFDDTCIAFLCDPEHRDTVKSWGRDPDRLLEDYCERLNAVIDGLPEDVTITLHQCRGNREGNWAADGGYDPVADALFNRCNVHGYFLEWDSPRAGGFEPLRLLPKGKVVAMGLVNSKSPELDDAEKIKRRIDEASKFAPLEQLALTPQCGFASSIGGNPLNEAQEEKKLAQLVAIARDVWGEA
jgi:5-methyltetrahydropteroyltriglutamate--homocysteine methyltransferase